MKLKIEINNAHASFENNDGTESLCNFQLEGLKFSIDVDKFLEFADTPTTELAELLAKFSGAVQ